MLLPFSQLTTVAITYPILWMEVRMIKYGMTVLMRKVNKVEEILPPLWDADEVVQEEDWADYF